MAGRSGDSEILMKFITDRCNITEDEFLNGIPACFISGPRMGNFDVPIIMAIYEDGKIIIEASTYESAKQSRRAIEGLEASNSKSDFIIINDVDDLEASVKRIYENKIVTKMFIEDENRMTSEFIDKWVYALNNYRRF